MTARRPRNAASHDSCHGREHGVIHCLDWTIALRRTPSGGGCAAAPFQDGATRITVHRFGPKPEGGRNSSAPGAAHSFNHAALDHETHDEIEALPGLEVREHERSFPAHLPRIAVHDLERGPH